MARLKVFNETTQQWQYIAAGTKGDQGDKGDKGDPGTQGVPGAGVPTGGSAGQVLAKVNSTNYNTQWVTKEDGKWGSISGSISDQTDLTSALSSKTDSTALLQAMPSTVGSNNQVLKVVSGVPAWATDSNTTYTGIAASPALASGATQATAINRMYIGTYAGEISFTLPTSAAVGSLIGVTSINPGGWRVTAGTGDNIIMGTFDTGATGYIFGGQYSVVYLRCVVANTTWIVDSYVGSIESNTGEKMGQSTQMGTVVHGSNASVARPLGYASVTWIGSVQPTNALLDDVWYKG